MVYLERPMKTLKYCHGFWRNWFEMACEFYGQWHDEVTYGEADVLRTPWWLGQVTNDD